MKHTTHSTRYTTIIFASILSLGCFFPRKKKKNIERVRPGSASSASSAEVDRLDPRTPKPIKLSKSKHSTPAATRVVSPTPSTPDVAKGWNSRDPSLLRRPDISGGALLAAAKKTSDIATLKKLLIMASVNSMSAHSAIQSRIRELGYLES